MVKPGRTVVASALLSWVALVAIAAQDVNPNAKLIQEYQERIKAYLEIHKKARGDAPKLKETEDPGKIKAAQDALAAKIRELRPKARQGEIFTPEIANVFRQLMYPEVKGAQGKATKEALKEDAPPPASVPFKVNARYPDEQPLPTVPPNLLNNLPVLPKELEYRIIDRHLILRDVDANIIVDYIPNAIR